jgi:type II secretory pathway component PulJ
MPHRPARIRRLAQYRTAHHRIACRQRRTRAGVTLTELATVVVLFALLMGVAIPFLARLQRGMQHGRQAVAEARTWERLARQFRRDAHGSLWLPPKNPPEGHLATLQSGERVIVWRHAPGEIRREALQAGLVVEREVYRLSDLESAEVRFERTEPVPLRLTLFRRASGVLPTAREAPSVPYSVEAQLAAE